jgi:FtsZ-binding cell division protein ZapB
VKNHSKQLERVIKTTIEHSTLVRMEVESVDVKVSEF